MNAASTARIALSKPHAETGLTFEMVYLPGSDREQGELVDSLQGRVATTRVLKDDKGYALAVIPRAWVVDPPALREEFGRNFRIAEDAEIGPSCLRGIPIPVADARQRGIEVILEQSLVCLLSVYFETALPHLLIHLDGESFRRLFYGAWCGCISHAQIAADPSAEPSRAGAGLA